MEMNITENRVRWPTVRVIRPIDHARLTVNTSTTRVGLTTWRKAIQIPSRVRPKAR